MLKNLLMLLTLLWVSYLFLTYQSRWNSLLYKNTHIQTKNNEVVKILSKYRVFQKKCISLQERRYKVSQKRRSIVKILKVDNLNYFTFLIITEQIRNIFDFLGNGRLFWETLQHFIRKEKRFLYDFMIQFWKAQTIPLVRGANQPKWVFFFVLKGWEVGIYFQT